MKKRALKVPVSNATNRIFRILECLSFYETLKLDQLAQKTKIPTSSALRFVQTCVQAGYIEVVENKKYRLSTKLFSLAHAHMQMHSPVISYSHSLLQELCYKTDETCHLGILSGKNVLYVDKIDSPQVMRLNSYVGYQAALHSTAMGKALMAWLPKEAKHALVNGLSLQKFTKNTIVSKKQLLAELDTVQKKGYATDKEEQELHLLCSSVPVFDAQSRVVAALSVSIPIVRYAASQHTNILKALWHCGESLSKKLGNMHYKNCLKNK